MNKFFVVLLMLITTTFASRLDTLIEKSRQSEQRQLHGFLITKKSKMGITASQKITHEKSLLGNEKSLTDHYEIGTVDFYVLNKVDSMEVELAKTTVLIESLQKQVDNHADNSDFNLKLIEILAGLIATIFGTVATDIISRKMTKKGKNA